MNTKTKEITLIGLMTAIICIAGPLTLPLPFSPVPISMATLAIYFSVYLLGMKCGTISCCVYLLLGLVGLPVFSAFTGGLSKLLGPTGGYLIGYIFMALIIGYFVDRWNGQLVASLIGMFAGTAVMYAFGTIWLAFQANMGFDAALAAGVLPFVVGDTVKIVCSLVVGAQVRMRVKKAALN